MQVELDKRDSAATDGYGTEDWAEEGNDEDEENKYDIDKVTVKQAKDISGNIEWLAQVESSGFKIFDYQKNSEAT